MLGKTSKLGNVKCFGLPAGITCKGSIVNGKILPVCAGCYAKCGNYRFSNVKSARQRNLELTKDSEFVNIMVDSIGNQEYFRWFDSGDVYSKSFANKIYEVCKATPRTNHWLPSKTLALPQYRAILAKLRKLPNVTVRLSYGKLDNRYSKKYGAVTLINDSTARSNVYVCPATKNHGSCGTCKACWDKSVGVIGYVAHGQSIQKVIRELGD